MSELVALLAGRLAAKHRQGAYARALLAAHAAGRPCPVAAVQWAEPSAEQWAHAARICLALASCQVTLQPIWRLGIHWQQLPDPPVLLCTRGDPALLATTHAIAIVGARRCSPGGSAWAHAAGRYYASAGGVVVSGGAFGIDSAAHAGAVAAGGRTLAIVGSPIDQLYPRGNQRLYQAILAHGGAIVSEHPPLTATYKSSHARRNRLIAGCSRALLVVQAALASGSMGAARYARALGRPVWVAPASAGGERGGIEALLANGAAQCHPDLPHGLAAAASAP